jgi:hypothetical protein
VKADLPSILELYILAWPKVIIYNVNDKKWRAMCNRVDKCMNSASTRYTNQLQRGGPSEGHIENIQSQKDIERCSISKLWEEETKYSVSKRFNGKVPRGGPQG